MIDKAKLQISKLDRYPSIPQLSWGGKKQNRTTVGGIIGILFIIIIVILVISKLVTLFKRQEYILNSFVKRDIGEVSFDGLQVMFVMMYYDNGTIDFLSYSDYQYAGIDVYIASIMIDYRDKKNPNIQTDLYYMKPCVSDYMLCNPFITYNPQCSYDSMDFQVCDYVQQFHIIVTNRTQKTPSLNGLYPMLLVFDNKFDIDVKDPKQILQRLPTTINKLPNAYGMGSKFRYLYEVPISKLELTVDQSIMPNSVPIFSNVNYTETHFYPNDKLRLASNNKTFFLDILPTYFDFYMFRSGFTESYKRSYYRLDMMLGQVFGLVGFLSLFFAFFCSGYNRWLMQIHIQACLKDQPLSSKDQSYLTYIKQSFPCTSSKKKQKNQQQYQQNIYYTQNNQQNSYEQPINSSINDQDNKKQIDIIQMYKKIQNMDRQLKILKQQQYRIPPQQQQQRIPVQHQQGQQGSMRRAQ